MNGSLYDVPALGVAGNFTGHLEQAGEARDFAGMKAAANAPKALFPTYIPGAPVPVPGFLGVYPFDDSRIVLPAADDVRLQIEPECALTCSVAWEGERVSALVPLSFCASNDCSIRREGARKISQKKNWGACSKGIAARRIPLDSFAPGGILDRYRIASFLVRGGGAQPYGVDSAVCGYSYMYGTLADWIVDRLNCQRDEGPAEDVGAYLRAAGKPERLLVSIGATRYTPFGEHTFLEAGDESVVVLYPADRYDAAAVADMAARDARDAPDVSLLRQRVVRG